MRPPAPDRYGDPYGEPPDPGEPSYPPPVRPRRSRLERLIQKAWWLHSLWALAFGVGVMIFARQGLAYADSLLMILGVSWLLMFVALRSIVGPANRSPDERRVKKGVRLFTNYVIKNLYQQMFFFLVPLYASSATWSIDAYNWWLPPVLLVCAVLSTMDLVFDNIIMERRVLASAMYGLAMFGVLNLMLPIVFPIQHFESLVISAAATPPAVALLGFRLRTALRPLGLALILACSAGLVAAAWVGRAAVPPVPLAASDASVGHGTTGTYECLPPPKRVLYANQLEGLRCGVLITAPGGLRDQLVHVWRKDREVVARVEPLRLPERDCAGIVMRSRLVEHHLPADSTGSWECRTETADGQLIGITKFEVKAPGERPPPPEPEPRDAD
jgi:hypothetical protein